MTASLTLYTNPQSRGRIARWMLEEVGQPYEVVQVGFGPEMQTAAYRALNPMAKVPTLTHGDAIVTECAAIVAYLADAFPEAGLAPAPASPARGPYYRWLFFAAGPVEQAVTNRALGFEPPPERSGMIGYGSFERVLDTLDAQLSKTPYVAGDKFTAADLYLGSHVGWGISFGTIPARPSFEAYFSRLAARPAYRRATELDDAALPKEA
jgi:glutathione S-transferase